MNITKITTGIMIFYLILFINLDQTEGQQVSSTFSIDISQYTPKVHGFVIADSHFWVLGVNKSSGHPDFVNILYKIDSNGDLVDSYFLTDGEFREPFIDDDQFTGLTYDGSNLLITGWLGTRGSGINEITVWQYSTSGENLGFTITPITQQHVDLNFAYGDNKLWIQTLDKIDSIYLDTLQFSDRLNHPGIGGSISVEDIFWGNNNIFIQYGNDRDRILIEYDYINDETITRYSIDQNLVIHDIYYDGENFWSVQEMDGSLSITTIEPTLINSEPNNYGLIAVATLTALGILGFSVRVLQLRKNQFTPLSKSQFKIIKDIFQSQTSLYYVLIGKSVYNDKSVENEVRKGIPENILKFKFLLHPVRLSLTKLLFENMELSSIELREIVEIPWNDYHTHIKALEKREFVHVTKKFIDGSKRQVVTLTPHGSTQFKILTDLLHLFLDNSSEYSSYINNAINLKNEFSDDVDALYPNN